MMVRRQSAPGEIRGVGPEASEVLSAATGITDVRIESQYVDRATLSFHWEADPTKFDSRLNFSEIDEQLKARGMHRMQ